jgi:hypothetical protein
MYENQAQLSRLPVFMFSKKLTWLNEICIHGVLVVHVLGIGEGEGDGGAESAARHQGCATVAVTSGHRSGEERIRSGERSRSDDVQHEAFIRQHRLQLHVILATLHELERGPGVEIC